MAYWGHHLVANFGKCSPSSIRCAHNITNFSNALVKKIDMVPYGEPMVKHFGSGNKAGFTLVQLIETSNITAHFVEETNDIYLDVFSCKKFDHHDVNTLVYAFFGPSAVKSLLLKRQAPIENEMSSHKTFGLN